MNPGAQLAALRRKVPHVCPVCGTRFIGHVNAVYCLPKCCAKAWRERHKKPATS